MKGKMVDVLGENGLVLLTGRVTHHRPAQTGTTTVPKGTEGEEVVNGKLVTPRPISTNEQVSVRLLNGHKVQRISAERIRII